MYLFINEHSIVRKNTKIGLSQAFSLTKVDAKQSISKSDSRI